MSNTNQWPALHHGRDWSLKVAWKLPISKTTLLKDGSSYILQKCLWQFWSLLLLMMPFPYFFVFASLFDGDTLIYRGPRCEITLPHSHFQHKPPLSLRLNLSTSDGDTSPFSEHVEIRVEGVELRPRPPKDLRFISCTATEVRLKWAGPEGDVKPLSFQVYCDDVLLETTRELGYVQT